MHDILHIRYISDWCYPSPILTQIYLSVQKSKRVDTILIFYRLQLAHVISITPDRSFHMVCCGLQCRPSPGYENQRGADASHVYTLGHCGATSIPPPPSAAFRWIPMPYFKIYLEYPVLQYVMLSILLSIWDHLYYLQ